MNRLIKMSGLKYLLINMALFSLLIATAPVSQAASDKVKYQIDINNPEHHLADVTMLMPRIEEGQIDIMLPAWRPGKYTLLPLANGIRLLQAKDSLGNKLEIEQISTNQWRIFLQQDAKVEVSYQLYANELEQRTRHIDSTHAYLDLVSVLLYSPKFRNTPTTVNLDVPRGWNSFSAMKSLSGSHSFSAENYDVMADSPIETGKNQSYQFVLEKVKFTLVIWGKGNYSGIQMAKDLALLAKTQRDYWGSFPFSSYLFIVHATNKAKGATEHLNSTVIQKPRWSFSDDEGYLKFLDTASHELAHSWNVKSYRPAGLVPYDYQQPNYSKLLWFAEGGSSYIDTLLLLRSKLVDREFYLKKLAKIIDNYQRRPGRLESSASESSFNQWLATKGDRAINSSVNIYSKGELLSLWLDIMILEHSNGERSIQQIHQKLFEQFPAKIKGFSEKDLIQLLQQVGLNNAEKLWKDYVENTKELPLDELLSLVGLKLSYQSDDVIKLTPFTGISLADGSRKISKVLKNSPAWKSGLTVNDELVAINGLRITNKNLKNILKMYKVDEKISLSFFRNDELHRLPLKLAVRPSGKAVLETIENATDKQKALFKSWLGVGYPNSDNENSDGLNPSTSE